MRQQIKGIYKITNPKGKVYIGQSIDLKQRFAHYKMINCKGQKKLYSSLVKYGYENHIIEIITKGDYNRDILNELEKHYIQIYNSFRNGLNLSIGGNSLGSGENHPCYGEKLSNQHKDKISFGLLNSNRIYKPHTEESKIRMSNAKKGKAISKETIDKIKIALNNLPFEQKERLKKLKQNRIIKQETRDKISKANSLGNHFNAKKVIDINTNLIYSCAAEVAKLFNINPGTLRQQLNGQRNNLTNFKYLNNAQPNIN
jgi:group I intron endonuclease